MSERSPETWTRLLPLLDAALESRPDDPLTWLEDNPPEDAGLLELAREILNRAHEEGGLLDRSIENITQDAMRELVGGPGAGTRLGPYILAEEIGRGGMGVVHRANRVDDGFDAEVVIKLLPPAMDTPQRRARFVLERQLLASLRHPHIAQLLDGGFTASGQPYLVLEFVEGEPIHRAAEEKELGLRQRIRLFLSVLEAVAHAHRNLVVHRDLKPANVLVTGDGHVKLLDFGIAKVLEEKTETTALTRTGLPMMTPEYASPEQVRGDPVTTAVDVYQLGLLLHLLLTGVQPQEGAGDSVANLERVVCRTEIAVPSAVCTYPWRRRIRGDLDRILQRALAKEPSRRYASADSMAEDLRRHLDGLPILARGDSTPYRIAKFISRHQVWTATIMVAIIAASVFAGFDTTRVRSDRDRAQLEARQREEVTSLLVSLFRASGDAPGRAEEITARELLDQGMVRIRTELADQPRLRARMLGVIGEAAMNVGLYERALPLLEDSREECRKLFGDQSEEHRSALLRLGELQQSRRRFSEAKSIWTEFLELEFRESPVENIRARALHYLGVAERELGELESSERHFQESLTRLTRSDPVDSSAILRVETDVAALLRRQGRWPEAEAKYLGILRQARTAKSKGDEIDLGPILNNLGFLLRRQERLPESAGYYRECALLLDSQLGLGHPTTVMVRDNLAAVLEEMNRDADLEELLTETLRRVRDFQGELNWRVAVAEQNLARIERHRKAWGAAQHRYALAEAILRQDYGSDHAWTVCATMDRAVCQELLHPHSAADAFDSLATAVPAHIDSARRLFNSRIGYAEEALRDAGRIDVALRLASWNRSGTEAAP